MVKEKFIGEFEGMEKGAEEMITDLVEETGDLIKRINEKYSEKDFADLMQIVAGRMAEVLKVDDKKRKRVKDRKTRIGKFMANFLIKSGINGKYFGVLQDDVIAYLEGSGIIQEVNENLYELVDGDNNKEKIKKPAHAEGDYFRELAKKHRKDLKGREIGNPDHYEKD